MQPTPRLPDHRVAIDMGQFRVTNGTPKNKPIHRHRCDVVLTFSGLVDDREKPLVVNKAIWHAILRIVKVEPDHHHFDREFVKQVADRLRKIEKPPFHDDTEAMEMLAKVTNFFSRGREVIVAGERFAR